MSGKVRCRKCAHHATREVNPDFMDPAVAKLCFTNVPRMSNKESKKPRLCTAYKKAPTKRN